MNAARRPQQALEDKWERFKSYPRPMVAELIGKKVQAARSQNWPSEEELSLSDKEIADLRRMGVDKDMIPLLQDVVRGKRQFGQGHATHRSTLTAVSRGLGAIEATGAGFFSGTEEYQRKHHYQGKLLDYVSHPSRIYKELGAGFSEVPHSVRTGKTYGDLLRETTDKNSLTHKWAMPIGLGMSIFFDPTTYLSFGATSASKTAAYHILAEADKQSSKAATKLIMDNFGKNIDTVHGAVKANWKNFDEIQAHVRYQSGSPWTLGDALDQLKAVGLNQKDQIRRTKNFTDPMTGITAKATARQRLGATLMPQNVLGGRGIRFAGKEIPGTPQLGAKLAGAGRGMAAGESFAARLAEGTGEALIPDWGARHVIEDGRRASALVEMARYKSSIQKIQTDIGANVRDLQRPFLEIADDMDPDELLHTLAPGVKKAFSGVEPPRVLVKPEARRGIMAMGDDTLDMAQRTLKTNIRAAVDDQIEQAVKAGVTRSSVTKLWDDLAGHYDDPLRALAEFKFKASARALGKTFVKEILNDRRFALPMKPILSDAAAEKAAKAAAAGKVSADILDEVPAGFVEFTMGKQRWAVSDSMIDGLRDLTNPTRLDGALQRGFRRMNIVQDWWKLYATSPNPAFHVMNMIGATWNNALAHVYNPGDYFDAMQYLYRGRKEEAAKVGARFGPLRRVPQSTPEGKQAQAILSEAEARSGLGRSSFLFGDVTRGHFTPGQLAMSDQPVSETSPMFHEMAGQALESGKGLAARQLTPPGGFREPSVVHTQVRQAAEHTQIPAPIELVHPAMIPNPAEPLTETQRETIQAVISRHTHGHGTALDPNEFNMEYVRELKDMLDTSKAVPQVKVAWAPAEGLDLSQITINDLTDLPGVNEALEKYGGRLEHSGAGFGRQDIEVEFDTVEQAHAFGREVEEQLNRLGSSELDVEAGLVGAESNAPVYDNLDELLTYLKANKNWRGPEDFPEGSLARQYSSPKPRNWDEFHDAVIADLERLTKEQKVQYIKPSFPDAPFRTPGEIASDAAASGHTFPPIFRPTPQQMEDSPYMRYFPVLVDKRDSSKIFIGSPEDTHDDILARWGVPEPSDPEEWAQYIQGTGVFNDDGSIAKINIFADSDYDIPQHFVEGAPAWDDPTRLMGGPEGEKLQKAALDKANEIYARVSDKRVARIAPSVRDLAGDKPYLSYFRVYQDPKNPDFVIAGAPGDDHYEVVDELGLNPEQVKDWYQGTGVFDPDTGKIANVSIVREGNDDWEKAPLIPDNTQELSERALTAARELYGETGAKVVPQVVPEQLVVKGKLRKKAIARQYGVTVPRKVAGTALLATGNPIGFVAFMPELAQAGRRLSGTIEDMVRLAPFLKYSKNPQIAGVLREFGPINSAMQIEYEGFTKADQQIMYDIGANISRQFQFDYSNLTNFERYVAKTIFPFWTYYKNNLALQVQQLVKQPRLFGVALKTMNYINDNGQNYALGPWEEILPNYFQNLQAFQIPVPNSVRGQLGLPENMPLFLNPKMPFLSINLIPNVWDILRDPSKTTPQQLRELVAPVAGAWGPFSPFPFGIPGSKIMLEAGTGYNLGLNRPIDWRRVESGDTQEAYTEAPTFMKYLPDQLNKYFGMFKDPTSGKLMISQTGKYIVEQMTTPFINNLGSSVPMQGGTEDDISRQRADLVSWLTGVRLMPADVLRLNRNSAYTLLNALEAKQDRLDTQGKTMSEQDLELLAMVRADLKGIEALWDMREMDEEEAKNAP